MMAIGLGNQVGAEHYHRLSLVRDQYTIINSAGKELLKRCNVLFGVALVENQKQELAEIKMGLADEIEAVESNLLRIVRDEMPRLPLDEIDFLIIDEMGKDISGTGIDTKVVGRIYMPLLAKEPETPRVKRIIICDLTESSEGNAIGVGIADFVTERLVEKVNKEATYINAITGGDLERVRIPLTLKNVRKAVEVAARSVGLIHPEALRLMRIKNTKHLVEVDISKAYKQELSLRRDLEIIVEEKPFVFDSEGNLEPF
ncbi:hypothetical protein LCGC14_2622480 [marine sediment metagenome]|uniref:Uncharacterized protein n=1 Tax=marine sediment metagenome TaxID=412755 RepID=A0A0F9A2L7_9ZZZZ